LNFKGFPTVIKTDVGVEAGTGWRYLKSSSSVFLFEQNDERFSSRKKKEVPSSTKEISSIQLP
jgi:hypothetical protein